MRGAQTSISIPKPNPTEAEKERPEVSKADNLSKRNFRICSWNGASANRRGAVLEKMFYDFDVECLQEIRTCPHRPLVLHSQSEASRPSFGSNSSKRQKSSREWQAKRKSANGKATAIFSTETQDILTSASATDWKKAALR